MKSTEQIGTMLEKARAMAGYGEELTQLKHAFNDKKAVSNMQALADISTRMAEFLAEIIGEDAKLYAPSIVLDFKNLLNVVRMYVDLLFRSKEFAASKPHVEKLQQMYALHRELLVWYDRVAGEYRAGYNDSAD